jgi:hypothetical protein
MLQKEGDIDEDVSHRIKVSWLKWRKGSNVLCEPRMPQKLKANSIGLRSDWPCCHVVWSRMLAY